MTPSEFMDAVQNSGGRVYFEDGELKVWVPPAMLTDELRAAWPALKSALVDYLNCALADQAAAEELSAQ